MSNELEDYERLVDLAQDQRDEKSRLKGSLDTITSNLKNLGYTNIGQAKLDLKKKLARKEVIESDRTKKLEEFKKKYAKYL